jgi:hypothetical protein
MANQQPLGPCTRKIYQGDKSVTLNNYEIQLLGFLCNDAFVHIPCQIHDE